MSFLNLFCEKDDKSKECGLCCLTDMQDHIPDFYKIKLLVALETFPLNISHKTCLMDYFLVTVFCASIF